MKPSHFLSSENAATCEQQDGDNPSTTPHCTTDADTGTSNTDASNSVAPVQLWTEMIPLCPSLLKCVADPYNTSFAPTLTLVTKARALEFFRYDHTPIEFKDGSAQGVNFIRTCVIPFDIDNTDSDDPVNWVSPETIADRLKQLGINFWMVSSRHHQIPKLVEVKSKHEEGNEVIRKEEKAARPKFHVYLPLSSSLRDSDQFVRYCDWCIKTFNSDKKVRLKSQKIFGYGDNPSPFFDSWSGGRCIDKVLTEDDLAAVVPVQEQKRRMPSASSGHLSQGMTSEWFVESGEWRNHLADLEAFDWRFLDEKNGQLFFQTPDGDRGHGKHDGNIKDGVAYIFSRAPAPFEENKGYAIPQLFAGVLFGDLGKDGLAKFEERYLSAESMWRPFPIEALPEITKKFVQETAESIGIDLAFIGPPVLSAFSGLIGRSCQIELKKGYREIASIWALIVASSGSGKTPGLNAILAPIRKQQQAADKTFKDAQRQYEAMKSALRKGISGDVEKPVAPVPVQFLIDDATLEAVTEILEENPYGCALFQDELSCWLGGFDAYNSGSGGKELGFWLSVFNGVSIRHNRKTNKKLISATTPAVAICGGIQPGMIRKILAKNEHFFEAGLMARFLVATPPETPVTWNEDEVSPETEQGYWQIIGKLLGMRRVIHSTPDNPLVVKLSAEAKQRWGEFYNANSVEQHTVGFDAGRAAFAKLPTYAARITLVLHVVKHLEVSDRYDIPTDVSVETLEAALQLVEWFKGESMRLLKAFRTRPAVSDDEVEISDAGMLAIIAAIQAKGSVTVSDFHSHQIFRKAAEPAKAIRAKIGKLLEHGIIEVVHEEETHKGGGKKAYRLATTAAGGVAGGEQASTDTVPVVESE